MPTEPSTLFERVLSSYSKLSAVANDLNVVSDELGNYIAQIDEALKKLNLGISTWVTIYSYDGNQEHQDPSFWSEDLGFAKVNGKWCVCLRRLDGNYHNPDEESEVVWAFNDAARALRLASIDKIPELIESLNKQAVETTKKIQAKLSDVRAVAAAIAPPNPTSNVSKKKVSEAKARLDMPQPRGIARAMMEAEQQVAGLARTFADAQRVREVPQSVIDLQRRIDRASATTQEAIKASNPGSFVDVFSAVKK